MIREATQAQAAGQTNVELIEYARRSYNPLIQELADRFEEVLCKIAEREGRQNAIENALERLGAVSEELQTLLNEED